MILIVEETFIFGAFKNNPLLHILEQERVNRNKFIERANYYLGIIMFLRFSSVEMSWPGMMYQNFGLMHFKKKHEHVPVINKVKTNANLLYQKQYGVLKRIEKEEG